MSAKKGAIRIQQVRSPIGTPRRHRQTLRSLGLRRMHHIVEREDTPAVRGMVAKVRYMVKVIEDES